MSMLQGIQGANNIQERTFGAGGSFAPLPAGGYVCKILNVKVENAANGTIYIKLRIDIAEGEHAGFFQRRYIADKDSQYGQRWKGVYKIFLPSMNGDADRYISLVAYYKGQVNMIARSNNIPEPDIEKGYDPDIFKGSTIGVLFREASYNGNRYTEPAFLIEPNKIRSGEFEIPEPRMPGKASTNTYTAQSANGGVFTAAASQQSAFQQQTAQNTSQSTQNAFSAIASQTTAPTQTAPQSTIVGDLSDFEEVATNGNIPF